mgnify:CR=1 FL=1
MDNVIEEKEADVDIFCNNKITLNKLYDIAKNNCLYVTKKLFLSISDVTTPQGVLAVIEKKKGTEQIDYNDDIIVALDSRPRKFRNNTKNSR